MFFLLLTNSSLNYFLHFIETFACHEVLLGAEFAEHGPLLTLKFRLVDETESMEFQFKKKKKKKMLPENMILIFTA